MNRQPTRAQRRRVRRLSALGAWLAASACTSTPSPPWEAPQPRHLPFEPRVAVLEVTCDECTVTMAVGGQVEESHLRGLWTHRLSFYYRRGQIALTAVPTGTHYSVENARIIVDGAVVAEGAAGPGERVDLAAELRFASA